MGKSKTCTVLGLMCGSSMDGMDLAYCRFQNVNGKWKWELVQGATLPYSPHTVKRLKKLKGYGIQQYKIAEAYFSIGQSVDVDQFLLENQLNAPDLICWHGHTIFHNPSMNMTCQCGSGRVMADLLQITTVTDLRINDMMLGGKGAPIVPIADKHLFPGYDLWLNLGGISNITAKVRGKMVAFDICPTNQVLNGLAARKRKTYDKGGALAATGKVHRDVLKQLMRDPYFKKSFPKSLDNDYTNTMLELLDRKKMTVPDALATYCELVAKQVAAQIRLVERKSKISFDNKRMMVTGGGAFNTYLISRIAHYCACKVEVADTKLVNFKEAIAMAFIGVLCLENTPNVLASVTGAICDSVNGIIHHPNRP